MCFSASASFTLGSALIAIGIATTTKIKAKKFLPIALIPLLFGIQQYAEGVLWLYSETPSQIATIFKNIFLFFAFFFWPIWIPLSLFIAEIKPSKKIFTSLFLGLGIGVGILQGILIPLMLPKVYCSSIQYAFDPRINIPTIALYTFSWIAFILYALAIICPMFISSLNRMKIMGSLVAASAIIILIIDQAFFISMWCFFAALISLAVYYILRKEKAI